MARPISWLLFVREIHRSVHNSVRSHYEARDVGQLLGVSARSAQKIIELLPREAVGQAHLVKREDLASFLEKVREAHEAGGERRVRELLEELRKAPAPMTRKKIRGLVRVDADAIEASSLPANLKLRRGHLEIDWRQPVQLAEAMVFIAKIIETAEFDRDYCFAKPTDTSPVVSSELLDAKFFAEEISRLERRNATALAGHRNGHHAPDDAETPVDTGVL